MWTADLELYTLYIASRCMAPVEFRPRLHDYDASCPSAVACENRGGSSSNHDRGNALLGCAMFVSCSHGVVVYCRDLTSKSFAQHLELSGGQRSEGRYEGQMKKKTCCALVKMICEESRISLMAVCAEPVSPLLPGESFPAATPRHLF